jgi:hypothetical protein
MSPAQEFTTKDITEGWEFVNIFYDRRKQLYYCRLRKIDSAPKQNDWLELTDSGATMQIAFDSANALAAKS